MDGILEGVAVFGERGVGAGGLGFFDSFLETDGYAGSGFCGGGEGDVEGDVFGAVGEGGALEMG